MTAAPDDSRSCLLVTAAAGYGKSALLARRCPDDGVVRSAPDLLTDGPPVDPGWLGVDDLHLLGPEEQVRLVEALVRQERTALAVASREPFPAAVRDGVLRLAKERDATDLALTAYRISQLLAHDAEVADPEIVLRVADLTAGWPALVHFARDALVRDPHTDLREALTARGTPAGDWLRAHVLASLPADEREVLGTLVAIDPSAPVTSEVCEAVDARTTCGLASRLRRKGILHSRRLLGSSVETTVVPAVADVLAAEVGRRAPERTVAAVARAHEAGEAWLPAARAHALAGEHAVMVRLLVAHGEDIVRRGGAGGLVRLVDEAVGERLADAPVLLCRTYAEALRMTGDLTRARRAFAALVADTGPAGRSPGIAARVAGMHYMCGEFEAALAALDRVEGSAEDAPTEDVVDWSACRVNVLSVLGREDDAVQEGRACLEVAEALGETRALGVAHVAVARTCRGARRDLHYDAALRYATDAGDAATATRVLAARAHHLLEAARYREAVPVAREAARLARSTCPLGLQSVTLHNLGEALGRVGELDEALWHLACSVALCRRLGPSRAALGLLGSARLHRLLGHEERSRAAYLESVELARGSGDVQVLVPALCGLALGGLASGELALGEDEPAGRDAQDRVEEALSLASADVRPVALTTAGIVALALEDRASAADRAAQALAAARENRALDQLADALELMATATADPAMAREALGEAHALWSAGGAVPAAARVAVLIAALPDATGTERARGRQAERTLGRLGIKGPGGGANPGATPAGAVGITVLGPFAVTVGGRAVPLTAWRSRQARTLVKILAAHRGRVVTRARLCDLLWPDDDPARTGHRLSVLLAAVRAVLDPAKAWPPDRFIAGDQHGIRLDLRAVTLDADLLLRDAAHAAALLDAGDTEGAREALEHVDALYAGEAFDDEPEEWADALREEVRSAWARSVRRLATLRARAGRGADALGILVRLLAVDPYDEQVHRRLVTGLQRAGQHGEAQRALERWRQAMAEIGAPLPDRCSLPTLGGVADARADATMTRP